MPILGKQKAESTTPSRTMSAGLEPCAENLNAFADELPKEKLLNWTSRTKRGKQEQCSIAYTSSLWLTPLRLRLLLSVPLVTELRRRRFSENHSLVICLCLL